MRVDLRTFLLNDATISELVQDRVYWDRKEEQASRPFIVARVISDVPAFVYQGPDQTRRALIQLDVFDEDRTDAVTLTNRLESLLSGFSGSMGDTRIGYCFVTNRIPSYDPDLNLERELLELELGYD